MECEGYFLSIFAFHRHVDIRHGWNIMQNVFAALFLSLLCVSCKNNCRHPLLAASAPQERPFFPTCIIFKMPRKDFLAFDLYVAGAAGT
jgi:hypothetical protein